MKAFIQGINCTAKTIKELDQTAVMLGLPEGHSFIRRRISRAYDLLNSNKVTEITDGIFRVRSQYEPEKSYIVNLNHGDPYCNCPDGERTLFCKHRIASLLYLAVPEIGTVRAKALTNDASRLMDERSEPKDEAPDLLGGGERSEPKGESSLLWDRREEAQKPKAKVREAKRFSEAKLLNEVNTVGERSEQNDNTPSSSWQKLMECRRAALNEARFDWIRSDLAYEGVIPERQLDWQNEHYETVKQACAFDKSLFNESIGDYWTIQKEYNWGRYVYDRRYRFWLIDNETNDLRQRCFWCEKPKGEAAQLCDELIPFFGYEVKTSICRDCLEVTDDEMLTAKLRELYYQKPNAIKGDGLPKTAEEFWKRCLEAIEQVRAKKHYAKDDFIAECKRLDAEVVTEVLDNATSGFVILRKLRTDNHSEDVKASNNSGKRKVQMDKKLNTWIIEADGTKKAISCREIAEQFDSYENGIIKRLRMGIDSGADISTIELD